MAMHGAEAKHIPVSIKHSHPAEGFLISYLGAFIPSSCRLRCSFTAMKALLCTRSARLLLEIRNGDMVLIPDMLTLELGYPAKITRKEKGASQSRFYNDERTIVAVVEKGDVQDCGRNRQLVGPITDEQDIGMRRSRLKRGEPRHAWSGGRQLENAERTAVVLNESREMHISVCVCVFCRTCVEESERGRFKA